MSRARGNKKDGPRGCGRDERASQLQRRWIESRTSACGCGAARVYSVGSAGACLVLYKRERNTAAARRRGIAIVALFARAALS